MKLEILTIGREILDGRVIDTNSSMIAQLFRAKGLTPRYAQKIDDERQRMLEAFELAQKRSQLVIVTGGLGPTQDDLSAEVFSEFVKSPYRKNSQAEEDIIKKFKKIGLEPSPQQLKQALMPWGATPIKNNFGTAPGFHFNLHGVDWYFLPGVPSEALPMLREEVLPKISGNIFSRSHVWTSLLSSEGALAEKLKELAPNFQSPLELGYQTQFPYNHVLLFLDGKSEKDLDLFEKTKNQIQNILESSSIYSGNFSESLPKIEERILEVLTQKDIRFGSVESCTGGLISHLITQVPGSSQTFMGSWVTYHRQAKIDLGVSPELIETHGEVSPEVSQAMAQAGIERLKKMGCQNAIVLATTGIAGPGGATPNKEVGLCYISLATSEGQIICESPKIRSAFDRSKNKIYFAHSALKMLWTHLQSQQQAF